jgi:hypothetical protein
MSINPKIKNEKISDYLGTDDAIDALERAVNNGQTRLALDVTFELLSEVTQRLMLLEEALNAPKQEVEAEKNPVTTAQPINKAKPKDTSAENSEEEKK